MVQMSRGKPATRPASTRSGQRSPPNRRSPALPRGHRRPEGGRGRRVCQSPPIPLRRRRLQRRHYLMAEAGMFEPFLAK